MKKRFEFTPDPLPDLQANEVFVFGANSKGAHGGGAAKAANTLYGAIWGEVHRTGRCYGLITVIVPHVKVSEFDLEEEFKTFFDATLNEPEKIFYLTKVGLGLGGWTLPEIIKPLKKTYNPSIHTNVVLPIEFAKELSNS